MKSSSNIPSTTSRFRSYYWIFVMTIMVIGVSLGTWWRHQQKHDRTDRHSERSQNTGYQSPPPDTTEDIRQEAVQKQIVLATTEIPAENVREPNETSSVVSGHFTGDDPGFRLCAMTSGGAKQISVGVVDRKTGKVNLLKPGDRTATGWRLVSARFKEETALFEKDGQEYTASLEQGERNPPAVEHSAVTGKSDMKPTSPPASNRLAATEPKPVFSNRVYHVEGFEPVAINAISDTPEFVEVKTGGETYALRRDIVESIFKAENLTTEDQLRMMVSYPGLATVGPGRKSSEQAIDAERQLAEQLIPPTNTPPLAELEQLRKNFVPPPLPDSYPKKP